MFAKRGSGRSYRRWRGRSTRRSEKAAKGDADMIPAVVTAFLTGNPAAVAMLGDVGRQLLVKLVRRFASNSKTC